MDKIKWIMPVTRRNLLRNSALAASVLVAGVKPTTSGAGAAATSPSLDQFIAVSERVTGQSPLDSNMGQNILKAFMAAGQGGDIATLLADPAPEHSQLKIANAIVAAWYSGLSPLPGARQVTGFDEAVVWDALSYTKPWGSCGGETGYWGEPPSDQEP
jgi:hypothetical protein